MERKHFEAGIILGRGLSSRLLGGGPQLLYRRPIISALGMKPHYVPKPGFAELELFRYRGVKPLSNCCLLSDMTPFPEAELAMGDGRWRVS